jgi:hypothetical protein
MTMWMWMSAREVGLSVGSQRCLEIGMEEII